MALGQTQAKREAQGSRRQAAPSPPNPSPTSAGERVAAALTLGLLLLAGAWLLFGETRLSSDLYAFLLADTAPPAEHPEHPTAPPLAATGAETQQGVLLAALSGAEPEQLAQQSRTLASRLTEHPAILQVHNGQFQEADAELTALFDYRYLLSPLMERDPFAPKALQEALERRYQELLQPGGGATPREWLLADPIGAWPALLESWFAAHPIARAYGVWFAEDRSRALLLIETRAATLEPAQQQAMIEAIHRLHHELSDGAATTLAMTGSPLFAATAHEMTRSEITRLSLVATLLIVAVLLLVLRSPRALLLVGLPLGSGLLGGSAAVTLLFGEIHGITLAFGIILVGISIDYPLHLLLHQRRLHDPWTTARHLWPALRLSAATTALGFAAMALADLAGLAQLGTFAVAGLMLAMLTTRFVLPWLLPAHPAPLSAPWSTAWTRAWRRVLTRWAPRPESPQQGATSVGRPLFAAAALLGALAYLTHTWSTDRSALWEEDLSTLNPIPEASRALDAQLREEIGVGDLRHLGVIHGTDAQEVLQRSHHLSDFFRELEAAGYVSGVDHPARWLAPIALQQERRAALPERDELDARLDAAAAQTGFQPEAFEPFIEAVAASAKLEPITPEQLPVAWLHDRLSGMLVASEHGHFGIIRFTTVADPAALRQHLAAETPDYLRYYDPLEQSAAALQHFRQQALQHLGLGLLAMFALLWLGLRSLSAALRVLAAPVTAVLLTAALLVATGHPLSIFHLVSLLLVAGLGIDYAVFYRRHAALAPERAITIGALALCLASSLVVFGALATSQLTVLAQIGQSVVPGALLALALAWLLQQPTAAANTPAHLPTSATGR
ncbi:hypothetical protein CKO15_10275 [Halorhodospira abdelmalekii]|uniref:MMPL family transporter n=1 Tax=Halorhodospira abdelmalekii TaxID=421629 RepID=UPI00190456C3|nr:MMPL family transporter [Halorhodospira abdelmalekii]MBK1735662.1 hypothetical protein [Halorhodospira abdelmalekii]